SWDAVVAALSVMPALAAAVLTVAVPVPLTVSVLPEFVPKVTGPPEVNVLPAPPRTTLPLKAAPPEPTVTAAVKPAVPPPAGWVRLLGALPPPTMPAKVMLPTPDSVKALASLTVPLPVSVLPAVLDWRVAAAVRLTLRFALSDTSLLVVWRVPPRVMLVAGEA